MQLPKAIEQYLTKKFCRTFIPALEFSDMRLSISACVHHRADRATTQVAVS